MIGVLQAENRREVEAFDEWLRMRNFLNCARLQLLGS
jgi:hypothetical protein